MTTPDANNVLGLEVGDRIRVRGIERLIERISKMAVGDMARLAPDDRQPFDSVYIDARGIRDMRIEKVE